jgi:hypothetical protein
VTSISDRPGVDRRQRVTARKCRHARVGDQVRRASTCWTPDGDICYAHAMVAIEPGPPHPGLSPVLSWSGRQIGSPSGPVRSSHGRRGLDQLPHCGPLAPPAGRDEGQTRGRVLAENTVKRATPPAERGEYVLGRLHRLSDMRPVTREPLGGPRVALAEANRNFSGQTVVAYGPLV